MFAIQSGQVIEGLVMACHITGIYDVNRSTTLQDDDYALVQAWAESVAHLQLKGVIFHNNFSAQSCERFTNEYISFVKIDYHDRFNPNVFRYFVYRDFLKMYGTQIKHVFVTDVSDVVVVQNPFSDLFYIEHPHCLFCGDEPKTLENDWMHHHSAHLRSKIADFAAYEADFAAESLLNCGVFGGNIQMMQAFIDQLCHIHQAYNHDNKTAYTGDMGAFNYLARTQFNAQLVHGAPVNTVFKQYENQRTDCWFRHK
jgi:hypothetical protein